MNNKRKKNAYVRAYTAFGIGLIALGAWYTPPIALSCVFGVICTLILIYEWPQLCNKNRFIWLLTPLYPILPFILLILINHLPGGRILLILLFSVTWAFDTGGYIFGSLWGKNPIAPSISPGKTWEGVFGGFFFATIVYFYFCALQTTVWMGIYTVHVPIILCLCGLMGDLFESLLKRNAQIKDSGHLLPGHGGFLDRFDGILCGIFYVYLTYSYLFSLYN